MSAGEFAGWRAYYVAEPWGCEQEDLRAGIIASVIANVYRDKKARPEPFTPGDFISRGKSTPKVPARAYRPKDILQVVEAMTLANGGKDYRQRKPRYE